MMEIVGVIFALFAFVFYIIQQFCDCLDECMERKCKPNYKYNDTHAYSLFYNSEVRDEKTMFEISKDVIDLGVVELLQFLVDKMTFEERIEVLEFTFVNKHAREASIILTNIANVKDDLYQALAYLYSKNLIGEKGLTSRQLTSLQSVQHTVELFEVISYTEKGELTLEKLSTFFLSSNLKNLIDAALLVSKYREHKEQYDAIILRVSRGKYRYTGNNQLLSILASVVEKTDLNPMLTWKASSESLSTYFRIAKAVI